MGLVGVSLDEVDHHSGNDSKEDSNFDAVLRDANEEQQCTLFFRIYYFHIIIESETIWQQCSL